MSRGQITQGAYPTRLQLQETALEKAVRAPLDLIWGATGSAKRQWRSRTVSPDLWSRMDRAWRSTTGKHLPPDINPASACLEAGFWLDTGPTDHDEALTAVVAAVFALAGRRVHVVEESLSETKADVEKLIRFWRGLGLSAARHEGDHAGVSPYAHDILVVPLTTLMNDFLHDVIKVGDPRNLQSFHTAALSVGGRAGEQWRMKGLDVLLLPKAASFAVDRPHSTATLVAGDVAKSTLGRITLHRFLSRYRDVAAWDTGLDVVAPGVWAMYRRHIVRWPHAAAAPTRNICRRNLADTAQEIAALAEAAANEGRACSVVATADRLAEIRETPGIPASVKFLSPEDTITGGGTVIDLIPIKERARLRLAPEQGTRITRILVAEEIGGFLPAALFRSMPAGVLQALPSAVVGLLDRLARHFAVRAVMAALERAVAQEKHMNDLLAISPGRAG